MLKTFFDTHRARAKVLAPSSQPTAMAEQVSSEALNQGGIQQLRPSRRIAIMGTRGGVGASTMAINLAAVLGVKGASVLVDCHLQDPDVGYLLASDQPYTLMDLLDRQEAIEKQVFEACALKVGSSSFRLLTPPLTGRAGLRTDLSEVASVLDRVADYAECWVLDLPRVLDRHLVSLLDSADEIVLVTEPSLMGVAGVSRWLQILQELGYSQEKVSLVINRCAKRSRFIEARFCSAFSNLKIFRLPNDFALQERCVAQGQPAVVVNARHAYCRALRLIAEEMLAHRAHRGGVSAEGQLSPSGGADVRHKDIVPADDHQGSRL